MHRSLILIISLFLVVQLLHSSASAQVIAGIRVNGSPVNNGDVKLICQGNSISFESAAQNATTVTWRFNSGTPSSGSGAGPFKVTYSKTGTDTVFQNVSGGASSDSMYVIIQVSNDKPAAVFSFPPDVVCGNAGIQFGNNSVGNNLTYLWDFADGTSSTELNPSHQFLTAIGLPSTQQFRVKLVATNPSGCKDSVTNTVTVKRVPDASLDNADPNVRFDSFNDVPTFKYCNNIPSYPFKFLNVTKTASSITGYSIHWGDNAPDSTFTSWPAGTVITHVFPLGSSTMIVRATGTDGCVGIKQYIVFLGSIPSGGLSSLGNEDICVADSLRFLIKDIGDNAPGTLYSFLINDGSLPQRLPNKPPDTVGHLFTATSCSFTSSNGNDTYNNAFGAYLTIQNPCGTKSPSVVPIFVSGTPKAKIDVLPAENICVGTTAIIRNASSFGAVVTRTGTFSSTCSNTGKQVWSISPSTGYTLLAGSDTGNLNNSNKNGLLWRSGSANLNINFTRADTYSIKLYIFNNRCGLDSVVRTVCVRNLPQARFTMPRKTGCVKDSLVFTNTSPQNSCGGDEYKWEVKFDPQGCTASGSFTFINSTSATSFSPEIRFNTPGRYFIKLTVTAKNAGTNCFSTLEDTFNLKGPPKITLPAINSICPNDSISPRATVTTCNSPGPLGYLWTFNGGTPSSSTIATPGKISYSAIGTYYAQLAVTDSSCSLTIQDSVKVTVISAPAANAGRDTVICSGTRVPLGTTGVSGVTYQWFPSGLISSTVANPSVVFNYTGSNSDTTYYLKVRASAGANCFNEDSVTVTVKRKPVISVQPLKPSLCIGDSVELTASGAISYLWSPAAGLNNSSSAIVRASPQVTTTYTVKGVADNGCADTLLSTVTVYQNAKAQFTLKDSVRCAPVNLDTIVNAVLYPAGNSVYTWFVNGVPAASNTTGKFPSYPLNGAGQNLVIKLVTLNGNGCRTDSMEKTFRTVLGVASRFSKNIDSACGPLKAYFRNTSSLLNGVQFFWNFGNGTLSRLSQPDTITFNNTGINDTTYYITLKAYNGCDTTVWRDSIKVFPPPSANFGVSATKGCSPFEVTVTNVSTGNSTYYWDFGDGQKDTTYTAGSFKHTYYTGVISTYIIRMTTTTRCGTDSRPISLLVSPSTIKPNITVNGDQLYGCASHTAVFNSSSVGAARLVWNFGDGHIDTTSNIPSFQHVFNNSGIYIVKIRLLNDCTDTTISTQVTVYDKPKADFTLSDTLTCIGGIISTSNVSKNANAYEWFWGDGTTSVGVNSSHTYSLDQLYTVRLVAQRLNSFGIVCTDTLSKQVRVVKRIQPAIVITSGNPCSSYTLGVSAANANNARSIEWTFYDSTRAPGVFYANGANASYLYSKPGTYTVKLVVQNAADCKDSSQITVNAFPTPIAVFTPANILTCNTDTTISFISGATYTGTDGLKYNWYINDSLRGAGNPFTFRFTVPANIPQRTVFTIKVKPENTTGCGDAATYGTVTIQPLAKPAIHVDPGLRLEQPDYKFTFRDTAAANVNKTYLWDLGDKTRQQLSGRQITYTYGDTGTYRVKLTVTDFVTGCMATDSVKVAVIYMPGYLHVPNAICPACSEAALRQFLPLAKGLSAYHLEIYTTWGQKVFETSSLDANGSPNEPWNGRWLKDGKPVQQDSYGWKIEARYVNGTEWKGMRYPNSTRYVKAGFITVIK